MERIEGKAWVWETYDVFPLAYSSAQLSYSRKCSYGHPCCSTQIDRMKERGKNLRDRRDNPPATQL